MARCNNIFLVCLLLLTSCSSAEHKEAIRLYELAKENRNIYQLTSALNTLAKLKPEQYQAEFTKVEKAQNLLEQAKIYQTQGDYYSAYLSSHDSYRSIPSLDGKKAVIDSGRALLPLLKAQLSIDESFIYRPKLLSEFFIKHSELPVVDWDLIQINSTVEQLSKALVELDKALVFIKSASDNAQFSEIFSWQSAIEKQLIIVTEARNYFSNLARYHSAKILIKLNENLSKESRKLLSLVSQKLAQESMEIHFLKAQNKYAPFKNLMANLSLAEKLSAKDIHADWYANWKIIETSILEPEGDFKNYPKHSQYRNKELTTFTERINITIPALKEAYYNKAAIAQTHPSIMKIIIKLRVDKSLIL